MQPKTDTVPKECRLNQSETVYRLCVTYFMLVDNGNIWWTYKCSISVIAETQFAIQIQVA